MDTIQTIEEHFYNFAYHEVLSAGIFFLIAYMIVAISRWAFKLFHRGVSINHELVEEDNFAFAITNVGYFIGVLFCVGGALLGKSQGIVLDILAVLAYGIGGVLMLNISMIINDKLILSKFKFRTEIIENKNISVALAIASHYIAIGLILMGTIRGEGGNLVTTFTIWAMGELFLYLSTMYYDFITPFRIQAYMKNGNIGVGIAYAGVIIAIGILIHFGIQDDFVNYLEFGQNLFVYSFGSILLMPIIRILCDKILLPGRKLTDEIVHQEHPNLGAASLEALSYVSSAILITWCIGS